MFLGAACPTLAGLCTAPRPWPGCATPTHRPEIRAARPPVRVIALYGPSTRSWTAWPCGGHRGGTNPTQPGAHRQAPGICTTSPKSRPCWPRARPGAPDGRAQGGLHPGGRPCAARRERGRVPRGSFAELMSVIAVWEPSTGRTTGPRPWCWACRPAGRRGPLVARTSGRPRTIIECARQHVQRGAKKPGDGNLRGRAGSIASNRRSAFAHLARRSHPLAPGVCLPARPHEPGPPALADRPVCAASLRQKSGGMVSDEMKYSRPGPRNVDAVGGASPCCCTLKSPQTGAKDTK
jgi:hypothetical protein